MEAGEAGRSALQSLMGHENPYVRLWAASHSLPFARKEALAVLRLLKKLGGLVGMNAEATLSVSGSEEST